MDVQVYSLARRESVSISAARALLTDATVKPEQYYRNCIDLFPLVLAPMAAIEIDEQRTLSDWCSDKRNKYTERYSATKHLNIWSSFYDPDRRVIPADLLPNHEIRSLPLLSSWKHWGEQLYGQNDFKFGFTETLRRDAVPLAPTVGHHIHADCRLDEGWRNRQLSLFSICSDQALEIALPGTQSWWTTQWHDMSVLPRGMAAVYENANINNPRFMAYQNGLAELCPAIGLPANHHVVMPSWFLHRASNLFDAPESYDELFPADRPQPKAYVSHATLYKPV